MTKFAVYDATSVTPAPYHSMAGIRELGARGTFSGLCQKSPAKPQNNAFDSDIACLSLIFFKVNFDFIFMKIAFTSENTTVFETNIKFTCLIIN